MGRGPSQSYTSEKVFCKKCHWLYNVPNTQKFECQHPNNRNKKRDTWYSRTKPGYRHPRIINKKNKCVWYDAKGSLPNHRGVGKKLL